MSMLKRGAISVVNASKIACTSRQAVQQWVDRQGWDIEKRQEAFAAREFARLMGLKLGHRRSKKAMRQEADDAHDMWVWKHGDDEQGQVAEVGALESREDA